MVRREWGVRWSDTGRVTEARSEREARDIAADKPDLGEVVSRWVRESPWKAESDA